MNGNIRERLKEYYDEMLRCTRCGFCQAACPTYDVLRRESATARGKVQLVRAISDGQLPLSRTVSNYLYACLGCRSCLTHCPGGVRTYEIFGLARRALAESEFFPDTLQTISRRVTEEHNISGEDNQSRLLWQDDVENGPGYKKKESAEVVFYIGCVSSLYPMAYAIPRSFVEILSVAGIDFATLGGAEWCCGYPLIEAGLKVDNLVEHNLSEVKRLGASRIVATCPSCFYTWTNYYPAGDIKVMHASQYLAELIESGRLRLREMKQRVTYHDPCDLGRKSQEYDAPRRILNAIPGLELVEMPNNRANAVCCGGGGNQESLNPSLSAAVADGRLSEAMSTEAQIIVSSCQQCERTLSMAARRARARIKVMDIVELVNKALEV